jgi:integrase
MLFRLSSVCRPQSNAPGLAPEGAAETQGGQRRTGVGGLAWSEVDAERGKWNTPGRRTKNHREHEVPHGALARKIIASVRSVVDRGPLFGARADRGFTSWAEHKRALNARLGDQVNPWRLHDLRRTVATRMADLGVSPHAIEEVLNHRSGLKRGVAGIYNRSRYEREVKAAVAT